MKKRTTLIYRIITILLASFASLAIFLILRQKPDAKKFIEKIRAENKTGFDSLNNALAEENALYSQIEKNIDQDNFTTASKLIDTLLVHGKTHKAYVYKGMIYAKQADYSKAIEQYNLAIQEDEFSIAFSKRAEAYISLNKLDLAINDYKKMYAHNYDFSLPLAKTFELKNQKDSALKYYLIYSDHYPNHQFTLNRIESLKSKSM